MLKPFETQPPITADRLIRFEQKTTPVPFCGCLFWVGGTNEHGYGVFWNGTRLEKAHRFALRASGVDVPSDADVCHSCDIPCCVNADHLFVGDAQSNVSDMWEKSRATVQRRRGLSQSQAKLTDGKAETIRALWATGRWKQRDIAAEFDVSQRLVWNVIHDLNWFAPSGVVVETGRGR